MTIKTCYFCKRWKPNSQQHVLDPFERPQKTRVSYWGVCDFPQLGYTGNMIIVTIDKVPDAQLHTTHDFSCAGFEQAGG